MPKSKKPLSEKQLAANRANAAKSSGPRTPEGKIRSAQNSRKHGFAAARYAVTRIEEVDEIARLRADLIATYQPVNSQELFAIERMAVAQQSILRTARFEAGYLTLCVIDTLTADNQPAYFTPEELRDDLRAVGVQNANLCLADGLNRMAKTSKGFSLFLRYQAQAERQYRRALEEFERLKRLRPELPNEPISADEPEQNTAPAAQDTNPDPNPPEAPPETEPQPENPQSASHSYNHSLWLKSATPSAPSIVRTAAQCSSPSRMAVARSCAAIPNIL